MKWNFEYECGAFFVLTAMRKSSSLQLRAKRTWGKLPSVRSHMVLSFGRGC